MNALVVLLAAAAALLSLVVPALALGRRPAGRWIVYGAAAAISAIALGCALWSLPSAGSLDVTLPLGLPWIGSRFHLDPLASAFAIVVNLGGAPASFYALGYGRHEPEPERVLPFYPAFLAGMNLVVLAADAFSFLVAWELMSLASWGLVMARHREPGNARAAYVYLLMASFGALCLLLAFGLLAGPAGAYAFAAIRAHPPTAGVAALVLALAVLGAGSKAGLVPLHVWLPLAHPAAPSHVSALMSGVMTKVAVYAFVRIVFDLVGAGAWWWAVVVLILGGVTAVIGVLQALMQHDLKRLLAYHTVENIGIIFIGLGLALAFRAAAMPLAAALAMTAALFHVLNHSLFKSLLFFGSGAVLSATGERDMKHLGGLIRRMPQTALAFLVGCVAISALPPLNGFVSEWLTFQAILLSPKLDAWALQLVAPGVAALLALSAALAAACFVKAYGVTFLGRPRTQRAQDAREVDGFSRAAMFTLAGLCLAAGVLPGFVIDALSSPVHSLVGARMPTQGDQAWLTIVPIAEARSSYNGLLVLVFISASATLCALAIHQFASRQTRRAPAWDCGAPDPSPATQYTAASFAQPIRRVFGTLVFAARETVMMPPPGDMAPARFESIVRDLIWEGIYAPIAAAIGLIAGRLDKLQFLTIRLYLTLVFLALIGLLVVLALVELIGALMVQGAQMALVLALAPLLTGFVRKVKARLVRRRGPPLLQPYRDLLRLMRKEVVLADSSSWLFRSAPYLIFAGAWVAAALVPTFATGLMFSWSADLIAIIALLGAARFFLALAGMDVGTSFGGIGASREVMIASLAEPAMLMVIFALALLAGSTQLSTVAGYMLSSNVGLRVTLALALVALIMVAIAENARIPVDNPATHLELTMVHEAMVLEYSGRHLAVIELAGCLKLLLYVSLISCIFVPWGLAPAGAGWLAHVFGVVAYVGKLATAGTLLALFETAIAKMRVFRVPAFLSAAFMMGILGVLLLFVSPRGPAMSGLAFDIAHLLAGGLVLISLLMLYQDRLTALINVFAAQAVTLALSVAWQAYVQGQPHLYITAAIALIFKALVIPIALHRIIKRLGIHREIDQAVGVGPTMLAGVGLVALALVVMLGVAPDADRLAREDLAFALSVVLLGLLMMVTRRNAVGLVVGFMSLENGLVLAATGAKGMPLVVEISVAFSVLIAFIVIGIFLFRIRERFETVDVAALDRFRGERG